jgi:hypothetical protein
MLILLLHANLVKLNNLIVKNVKGRYYIKIRRIW